MAGGAGILAGLVPCHQFQAAQGQFRAGRHDLAQGIERQATPGGLGGKEEDLVQRLPGHGLEQREQGAEGLADAGSGLGHQAAAGADRLVHGFRQFALALAKGRPGETQGAQAGIAQQKPLRLRLGPLHEAAALLVEVRPQLGGAGTDLETGFLVAVHVQVDQRQVYRFQPALAAHQPAIDPGLCPVQLPVVVRLAGQVAAMGLDLFQAVARRDVAVGTSAHLQIAENALQCHLRLVALAPPRNYPPVPGNALLGSGRRGETQVEVTDLGREFAKRAHRDLVGHAAAHCTWQTSTGRP